jgi:hypothetical protein
LICLFVFPFLLNLLMFVVIEYRPVVEELADIILSADMTTYEAIQHRCNQQVTNSYH